MKASPLNLNRPALQYLMKSLLFAVVYGAAAYLSFFLIPAGASGASLVWPVSAVGLAILLLSGTEFWPALFLSLLAVLSARGVIFPLAISLAAANTLEAFVGAYLLSRYFGFSTSFVRFRDTFSLIVASLISAAVSAFVSTGALYLFTNTGFNASLWTGLVIGHAVSLLTFAPFCITWFNGQPFTYQKWQVAEKVAVIGSIALLNILIFWEGFGQIGGVSLIYVLIIPLIWTAVRLSMRGMSLALALTGLIAVTGVLFGVSSFTPYNVTLLFALQALIGTLSLIFLIFSSITEERREAVTSLQEHIDKLENLLVRIRSEDEAKNEFIAILAHELRNPLAPIVSSVEIIRSGARPPEETGRFLSVIETHVKTMTRLLDDLLDISRISQKKFSLSSQLVPLQSIIKISLQTVEDYIKLRNHALIITVPPEPVMVYADPVRLEQALVNLLNNAAKYTEPGGRITLSVEKKKERVDITVADTGVGIPAAMQPLIFEPFSSVSSMRRPGGLGVGLYLSKRLIELHNGTVTVQSEGKNRGSKFTISLPVPDGRRRTAPAAAPAKPLLSSVHLEDGSRTVLVVDDNEPAAQGLSTLLTHSGYIAHMAFTGASALQKARELKPGAVLLDIGLPDMEGYEVAKRLREDRDEPFTLIAVTGYGQANDKQRAREAGFDHHLTKPVGIADVQKILSRGARRAATGARPA